MSQDGNAVGDSILPDRFLGCLIGGALGDALGAPLEHNFDFADLHRTYGDRGLQGMIPYAFPWGDRQSLGLGVITDDATMLASTLEAINLVMAEGADIDRLPYLTWQSYLHWGALQDGGESLSAYWDDTIAWSEQIKPFWFSCGAGRGTIAALQTGRRGTPENPIIYDAIIRGQRVTGPNTGCGGMMRVAPLAFLTTDRSAVFDLAIGNAAITHGAADAYLATAMVTVMIHAMLNGQSGVEAIATAQGELQRRHPDAGLACRMALEAGLNASNAISTVVIDGLPAALGYDNGFLAIPVLAQAAYCLAIADRIASDPETAFRHTLSIAVTHSGDSDSVGAIVGNCLGARWGRAALPSDWCAHLACRSALEALAQPFLRHLKRSPSIFLSQDAA